MGGRRLASPLIRIGLVSALLCAVLADTARAGVMVGASTEALTPVKGNGLIAFVSTRSGNADIFTMWWDGLHPSNLTSNPASDTDPAWSPDGTRIAFTSDRSGNRDVWVMNADGVDPVNLTNHPEPTPSRPGRPMARGSRSPPAGRG